MEVGYNLWHGCHKVSEGCQNCYVYRRDESIGRDASIVFKTKDFDKPIRKNRNGEYKYPSGTLFDLCFSSDFFIEEADEWRQETLKIIKERSDCMFFCITKRPERILKCIPDIAKYHNLIVYCTMENQKRFDQRAPIYLNLPLHKKGIMIEPMLEKIDMSKYISQIDLVSVGGETGPKSRILDYEWVKDIYRQCRENNIGFSFHQTGDKILVNGKLYKIERKFQHSQAKKALKNLSSSLSL